MNKIGLVTIGRTQPNRMYNTYHIFEIMIKNRRGNLGNLAF